MHPGRITLFTNIFWVTVSYRQLFYDNADKFYRLYFAYMLWNLILIRNVPILVFNGSAECHFVRRHFPLAEDNTMHPWLFHLAESWAAFFHQSIPSDWHANNFVYDRYIDILSIDCGIVIWRIRDYVCGIWQYKVKCIDRILYCELWV